MTRARRPPLEPVASQSKAAKVKPWPSVWVWKGKLRSLLISATAVSLVGTFPTIAKAGSDDERPTGPPLKSRPLTTEGPMRSSTRSENSPSSRPETAPNNGRPRGYGTPEQHGFSPVVPTPLVVPPSPEAGRYLHDGFYLHMALGFGSLIAKVSGESAQVREATIRSVASGLDAGVGGTPWPGVVLGARVTMQTGSVVTVDAGGASREWNANLRLAGLELMMDYYPWPTDGVHVLGALGGAMLSLQPTSFADSDHDAFLMPGILATLGVGWQGWIARQWSLGGLLSFEMGSFRGADQKFTYGKQVSEQLQGLSANSYTVLLSVESTFH